MMGLFGVVFVYFLKRDFITYSQRFGIFIIGKRNKAANTSVEILI